ncbi:MULTISPECIES: hypothetical protein [unclassified Thiocapsa]|uniref:ISAzo13-like element transposase-related protein n=1 Tax=unclassified Thiocapsa TaxID=2641286 RepID=UPI0035B33F05
MAGGRVARLSIDCKATVMIGEYSRGGCSRGETKAADHDTGCHEKYTPFGLVNEDTGALHLTFGSSAKTSDFIVDCLYDWWERQSPEQRERITLVRIKADNGPDGHARAARVAGAGAAQRDAVDHDRGATADGWDQRLYRPTPTPGHGLRQ